MTKTELTARLVEIASHDHDRVRELLLPLLDAVKMLEPSHEVQHRHLPQAGQYLGNLCTISFYDFECPICNGVHLTGMAQRFEGEQMTDEHLLLMLHGLVDDISKMHPEEVVLG